MSVRALLLLSCMHSLGLGLDLGNNLDWRELTCAHTRIAELLKLKRRLILNDTRFPSPSFEAEAAVMLVCKNRYKKIALLALTSTLNLTQTSTLTLILTQNLTQTQE